jgi:hypothetical protein
MAENIRPTVLAKKDFFQIEECYCGKHPFRYMNVSKNEHFAKCNYTKEEYDPRERKNVPAKKQPCTFYCVFYDSRPVFQEIKNTLIKKAADKIDKDTVLEEKLKLLFRFVFVSNHTSTLDEINILVKNSLRREPRKVYYFPSPGHLRISHYEPLEEYRDRIFSKKIIDLSHLPNEQFVIPKERNFLRELLHLEEPKPVTQTKKKVVSQTPIQRKKKSGSRFVIVSDDEDSENEEELSENELSDYGSELEDPDTESVLIEEEETEEIFEEEIYDDYDDGGDDYGYD